jgi:hypothetical protein
MSSKIINVVLVCLFTLCVAGKANAGLIVGELYEDSYESGLFWEYVGNFDLASGPAWNDANGDGIFGDNATPYNALEAAAIIFKDDTSQFAISAFTSIRDYNLIKAGDAVVNHEAWYDGNVFSINIFDEDIVADISNDGIYDPFSDFSAWINDRAVAGNHINHVFKSVTTSVPEPSTVAIFALALVGLTARRFKNK